MSSAIVWFRRDLRLEDNPALWAAKEAFESIICVYIHAPEEEAPWSPGGASRWWLHHSLASLDQALKKRGGGLVVRAGSSAKVLDELIGESGAQAVYWNRLYEPALIERDRSIKQRLRDAGVDARSFNSQLLIEPWQIETNTGGPYKVFTPFWRKAHAQLVPQPPLPVPKRIPFQAATGIPLDQLGLLPTIPWDRGFYDHWQPGEHGAHALLRRFVDEGLANYREGRDRPDNDHTSRLSPHLHFGEIGPRQIVWSLEQDGVLANAGGGRAAFIRELGWREFSTHLLYHFPQTPLRNLNPQFDAFPWAHDDAELIRRWQRGETGIPIVDAGMRQLWQSGWMHNRVRMIVASFLSKNLRQHWLNGARWFWGTLVDADLANNTQGWQWTAGSGADAAPYFRIFNPVSQGRRFDPNGDYVRRWVPELKDVATSLVHQPWEDPQLLARIRYPEPMVDLAESREEALGAYQQMRTLANG